MKTTIKVLTGVRYLMLYCLMPLCAWAANRTVTIEAPSSVLAGQSFVVQNYASTDAGDGEQVGFFHAQYSTDGGANWTWFAGDVNAGTFVNRQAYITAGGAGSTIIVRTRIAFRGGNDGDVDYNGSGIDWGGSWENWGSPPTRYAYISVTAPVNRTLTISGPTSVNSGESFSVSSFASTDATDGEQLGFFHGQYSTDGGATWTWFAGDVNAGASATRIANITAGYGGSTVIVRVRIAYRGGANGDVDFTGSALNWGAWDNWGEPPSKSLSISVTGTPPPAPGSLWVMGDNSHGQLGIDSTTNQLSPVQISYDVGSFSAGSDHSVYVKTDGALWGMGQTFYGQVGTGGSTDLLGPTFVTTGVDIVAAGSVHTIFKKTNGTLWGMGNNAYYELGDGTDIRRRTPVQISSSSIGAISAGWSYSQFVKPDNTLWVFGLDLRHLNQVTPTGNSVCIGSPQGLYTGVVKAAAGQQTCLFIKTDGTLWAMGINYSGQLGDGTTTLRSSPVQVATGVSAVATGNSHSMFIKTDGTLWAMGNNSSGQLGDGTTTSRLTPVQVATGVAKVAVGGAHTLFLKTDGSLWTMGSNSSGQLGDGTTTDRATPVQIATGVTEIAAGRAHSLFRY